MSDNSYDWLGPGIYFWEGNPHRALEFATAAANDERFVTAGVIYEPFVVGAVIDAQRCFDLQNGDALAELAGAYVAAADLACKTGASLPRNVAGDDRRARHLDCAVIRLMHDLREKSGMPRYDTVRGAFWEGGELYPGAGISAKQHVQVAVRNPEILAYFRPL